MNTWSLARPATPRQLHKGAEAGRKRKRGTDSELGGALPLPITRVMPTRHLLLQVEVASALGGNRTPNLLIRSQMLYPLSYERQPDESRC